MIEEIGTIVAADGKFIWVETQIKTTCGGCQANDHCGTGVVAKAFAPKTDTLKLPCSEPAEVGQQVKIGIPENRLVEASALVYMVPMITLVASALLASLILPGVGLEHEGFVILFAFVATALSTVGVRRYLQSDKSGAYEPLLLGLLPRPKQIIPVVTDTDPVS